MYFLLEIVDVQPAMLVYRSVFTSAGADRDEQMSFLDGHFLTKWRASEQLIGGWAPARYIGMLPFSVRVGNEGFSQGSLNVNMFHDCYWEG